VCKGVWSASMSIYPLGLRTIIVRQIRVTSRTPWKCFPWDRDAHAVCLEKGEKAERRRIVNNRDRRRGKTSTESKDINSIPGLDGISTCGRQSQPAKRGNLPSRLNTRREQGARFPREVIVSQKRRRAPRKSDGWAYTIRRAHGQSGHSATREQRGESFWG